MSTYWYIRHKTEGPVLLMGPGHCTAHSQGRTPGYAHDVTQFRSLAEARTGLASIVKGRTPAWAGQYVLVRVVVRKPLKAPLCYVTPEGLVKVPDRIIRAMGLEKGGGVAFLEKDGRVEMVTDEQLSEELSK